MKVVEGFAFYIENYRQAWIYQAQIYGLPLKVIIWFSYKLCLSNGWNKDGAYSIFIKKKV